MAMSVSSNSVEGALDVHHDAFGSLPLANRHQTAEVESPPNLPRFWFFNFSGIWRFFRQFLWIDWYKEQTMMHIETSDQKCKFHRSREGLSILMLDGNMMRRQRPRDYDEDIFRMMSQSLGRPAVQ